MAILRADRSRKAPNLNVWHLEILISPVRRRLGIKDAFRVALRARRYAAY